MDSKLILLLIPALTACSSAHLGLASLNAAASRYVNWTCQQLADEQTRLRTEIKESSSESQLMRATDPQREHQALAQAMKAKQCSGPKPIVAWVS
jgi:hypothetical protein